MFTFDVDYTLGLFPILLKYINITISLAVISTIIALIIAIIIAVIKTNNIKLFTKYISCAFIIVNMPYINPGIL